MKRKPFSLLAALLVSLPALASPTPDPSRLSNADDIPSIPAGQMFRMERKSGAYRFGDPQSIFSQTKEMNDLTFDISNNRVLGNMGEMGELKALTIYRDSYRHCANPGGFNGVWTAKDLSSYGPYAFTIKIDGKEKPESFTLDAKLGWDYGITLLDNIFPMAEVKEPGGRFIARLLAFAPISSDGAERPEGLVYHLWIENTGPETLSGTVKMPSLFGKRPEGPWAWKEPYEFETGFADGGTKGGPPSNDKPAASAARDAFKNGIPFSLKSGASLSVPLVLYMPGNKALDRINERGELDWFRETWRYYRSLLGRMRTPSDPWLAEFYEREVLQALQSLAMGPTGKLAGSNWGSYPATRQIWTKDTFYSALPLVTVDPALARTIIDWFHDNGVRHSGQIVEGGLNHSISLTVSSLMLAGKYYESTGDASFFKDRPALRKEWQERLDALDASRKFPDIDLYPTRFISDGKLKGDFHCGSNVAVWHALRSFARLLQEVYNDPAAAKVYAGRADRVKAEILKRTVIKGSLGPQFIEAIDRDGSVPEMTSDGEESETTLMPYYGFLPYDDPTYLNYMRFSMSPENKQFTPEARAINWGKSAPSTAPGYNKGLCAGVTAESLFGGQGFVTEIRKVTEADGSVWWWPVTFTKANAPGQETHLESGKIDSDSKTGEAKLVPRRYPGKAGWFAGVYSAVFRTRFAGLDYDAPSHTLNWMPLPALGDFEWKDAPFGSDKFSVALALSDKAPHAIVENPNNHPAIVRLRLPAREEMRLELDGKALASKPAPWFGEPGLAAEFTAPPGSTSKVFIKSSRAPGVTSPASVQ